MTSALQSVTSNCDLTHTHCPCAMPFESVPAEESAGQGQKRFMNVGAFFVANSQPSELVQPSEGSLHHPAPSPQSTAMFGVTLGKHRHDAAGTQTFPDCLCVITPVAQHAIRPMARSSSLSLQVWDSINQRECLLRVIAIGSGELDSQWNSASVADQMALATKFGPVGRIRSGLRPPKRLAPNNCLQRLGTNRSVRSVKASRVMQSGSVARRLPPASHANAASRSYQSRNQVPAAASPMEFRCAGRTEYQLDKHGLTSTV